MGKTENECLEAAAAQESLIRTEAVILADGLGLNVGEPMTLMTQAIQARVES